MAPRFRSSAALAVVLLLPWWTAWVAFVNSRGTSPKARHAGLRTHGITGHGILTSTALYAEDSEHSEQGLERPELPNSTELMCRQASQAVMRAYRDGYTRQAVRLRLDAAYSGQEDLKALLKATLPLAKSFATKLWNGEALRALKTSLVDDDVTTLLYRRSARAALFEVCTRKTIKTISCRISYCKHITYDPG